MRRGLLSSTSKPAKVVANIVSEAVVDDEVEEFDLNDLTALDFLPSEDSADEQPPVIPKAPSPRKLPEIAKPALADPEHVEPTHPLAEVAVPPAETSVSAGKGKKRGKNESGDDPDRFKKMKVKGSDQELLVDVKRLVKYSDMDRQANHDKSAPADFRSTIDYGDL